MQHGKELNNDIVNMNETDILDTNGRDCLNEVVEDSDQKLREARNSCEKVLPKSEIPEKSTSNEAIEQQRCGRRYITLRNLPLAANARKFRQEISKVCAPVSMGIVRINNMDYTLIHLQYKEKDHIEHIYQCAKQCEKILY